SQVLLRHLNITSDEAQWFQRLATRTFYNDPSLRVLAEPKSGASVRALWAQGISGDLPLVLLRIQEPEEIELARQLLRAHEYWRLKGITVDLVILNEDSSGYSQPVQDQIQGILAASPSRVVVDKPGGIFLRRADQIRPEESASLEAVARAVLV